ncbi:hypothetical protein [Streptomyces sp. NPDC049879]|uniref:hypothetical protein n=1 Tax=Streptomyces sp. NPDC049879 TaxID=3365598 RepID=UPI00379BC374
MAAATGSEPDTGLVHELVDAVRDQAGVPADESYRIPGGTFTPPAPTPEPQTPHR